MKNQILITDKVILTPEFKRKKKIYKFNFFLSCFLACTLFSCCIYAEYDRNKSEQVSQEILLGLRAEIKDIPSNISAQDDVLVVNDLAETEENAEESQEVDVSKVLSGENQKNNIVESVANDGTKYYTDATLKIPCLGIEYPVLSDSSDELLEISLNKLWGPNPNEVGNYVIVGHNYKNGKMFGKLSGIKIGDTFQITDNLGRTATYSVYTTYVVDPKDVSCTSQITDGNVEATLITCTSTGAQRFVVKGRKI